MRYQTDTDAFARLSRRLSPLQRAILRELRDRYLQSGPIQEADLADLGGTQNLDVRAVLNSVFERDGTAYKCAAFDLELEALRSRTNRAKKAANARWNADAMQVQCTCNADAMHMHGIPQPCGFPVDSEALGGDYRGGIQKKKKKSNLLETLTQNPPKRPPEDAVAWLDQVAGWFGRAQGEHQPEERDAALHVDASHRPKPADLAILARYYTASFPAGRDFRRRSVRALLANWATELDRARLHAKASQRKEAVV